MAPAANSNHEAPAESKATNYGVNMNGNNSKMGSRPRRLSNSQLQRAASEKEGGEEEMMRCECCGLAEECTAAYVSKVRNIFCGRWVCGLCAEAVKEERHRMGPHTPIADALHAHISLCLNFNRNTRTNPAVHVAHAMRQLLRKKSMPTPTSSPTPNLSRTASCIPSLK
ncbi:hypothetical protein SUGI_0516410 [Cryptomeria japonica]|uniref:uncharacterized protein LOC131064889 n=1 Tax=Cryptomeria japonica TaxID=3369 RepID=UPI002408C5A9|nr:uncharacterized protein LOC131064889 [Cryptomeria japonica]GLJ26602.1 hypothetical protein SUGI_0516410 [Cryptomeria japonica]